MSGDWTLAKWFLVHLVVVAVGWFLGGAFSSTMGSQGSEKGKTRSGAMTGGGGDGGGEASISPRTAIRWTTFDLVARLSFEGDERRAGEASKRLLAMLEEDAYETMLRLGELPEAHHGTNILPYLLNQYLPGLEVEEAGELIELLKGNEDLYRTVVGYWSMESIALGPDNDRALFDWIRRVADEPLGADGLAAAVGQMLFREGTSWEKLDEVWADALALPEGEVRSEVLRSAISEYLGDEQIERTGEYLESLESNRQHDEVFAAYAETRAMSHLEDAFGALEKIQEREVWDRVFYTIVGGWAEKDSERLVSWLIENNETFSNEQLNRVNAIVSDYGLQPMIEVLEAKGS
ncbi:MAG: hypothetical protein AAGC74_12850 [Verrucomicrobiota bacterium]